MTEKPAQTEPDRKLIPDFNIGTCGQIDNGKTSLTRAVTGKWTDIHSEEIKRGMTIRLGYADVTFRKCPKCPVPEAYTTAETCPKCGTKAEIIRTASFVDAPGHEALMSTMLSGAAIMDGVLLVIAANEKCPQPQTKEHTIALKIMGMKHMIVVQNKIDLVDDARAIESRREIEEFLKSNGFSDVTIIPASAQHGVNIDLVLEAIEKFIPTPKRDRTKPAKFLIARSFDVNKPGTPIKKLLGGVLGGALVQGTLAEGEDLEIRPGNKVIEANQIKWMPIRTKVSSLITGGFRVKEALPGGSLGIGTGLDPSVTKSDALVGGIAGHPGKMPDARSKIEFDVHLLDHVVGADKEGVKVEPLKPAEALLLNVNAGITSGLVSAAKSTQAEVALKVPVCVERGDRIAISRRIGQRWRLIGYGVVSK